MSRILQITWDDRVALGARVEDIRETRVREYLRDVRSGLLDLADTRELYRRMAICSPLNDHEAPKMHLATDAYRRHGPSWHEVNKRLLGEARDQLERVTLMNAPATRHAWAWRDLALVRQRLQAPRSDVVAAYKRASELLPQEERFTKELDTFLAAAQGRRNRNSRGRRR